MTLAFPLLLLSSSASIDRTGRRSGGHPSSSVGASVKSAVVQLGGAGGSNPGSLHAKWEKFLQIGPHRTKAACEIQHPPRSGESMLQSVSLSGCVLDVSYEASRSLASGVDGTDVQVAYSMPTGLQVMADAQVHDASAGAGIAATVNRLSAFHLAGPFNLQSSWLCAKSLLQLKVGHGARFGRCPVSFQVDLPTGPGADASQRNYEIGMRQELAGGRQMRGRLLLPSTRDGRSVWAEYEDPTISKSGVWIAKASLPLVARAAAAKMANAEGPTRLASALHAIGHADFSLRMALQW